MIKFNVLTRLCWTFLVALTLTLGLAGCEGDDGAAGAAGAPGTPGSDGSDGQACWDLNANGLGDLPDEDINGDGVVDVLDCAGGTVGAAVTPLESCGVCHSDGSFASAPAAHAVTGVPTISNVALAAVGADLQISYNLLIDGNPVDDFTTVTSAYVHTAADGATNGIDDIANPITVVAGANAGDFTATITDGVALAGAAARFFVRVGDGETRAVVSGDFPAAALADIVSDASCTNCHGPKGLAVHTAFGYPGMEASECVVCHKAEIDGLGFLNFEDSFVGLVHGIHNAHDFPEGVYEYDAEHVFDTTYPTYMTNCSVCHSEAPQLAAANVMPVSGAGCFTCHGSMASWDFSGGLEFHLTGIPDPATADCTLCHKSEADGGIARATVADFHNGATTGRGGIIWDGVDTSVAEGAKFVWQITGVVDDGTNLAISWQASYDGVGVDPCNATPAAGAPAFHAIPPFTRPDGTLQNRNNLSMLRNYAQGDDFILGQSTSAPGQALNEGLSVDNTTCAGNVATTTIPVDDVNADRGIVALQGKPWLVAVDPDDADGVMQVRVPTPTYEWTVGDGAPPVALRRDVVDTGECLACHVGSLYQHGGNRVDNVGMCILCHNSASNEKNVRVGMGVDESEAYDGKSGETFEMKTMLHRIHSAGVDDQPVYAIYRNRGIYAFAPDESDVPNWDVISTEGCTQDEIDDGKRRVFGSSDTSSNKCEVHNFHSATYPRALNDCAACHTDNFMVIPDQTKAMATTTEAGSEVWENQLDDTLQGAATTACVTCHADGASKGHAYQNSWTPQVFPEGRQTIIDAVN